MGVDPNRAARQNLRTHQMLGGDMVTFSGRTATPVFTMPAALAAPAAVREPAPAAVRPPPATPTAPSAATPPPVATTRPVAVRPAAAVPRPADAPAAAIMEYKPKVMNAKQKATQAKLDALRAQYEKDAPHKNFVTDHHCIVWGDGDPCARLMIIGEAPGAEEDKVGIPFVGRAGQLLEKMLGGMGLHRSQVYIANVLKTRPPNNATPTADEAAACAPYLFEQIKIIGPECILALGLPATRVLLNSMESMSRLRGRWSSYADPRTVGFEVPVMPTYHPAFLLRSYTRENREKVWSDLQMIMQRLGLEAKASAANPA